MYTFPFEVPAPEDRTGLTAEQFATLQAQVREHASTLLADENADPAGLIATRELHASLETEGTRRSELAAAAADARTALAAGLAPPAAPQTSPAPFPDEPPATPEPAPVPAAPAVVASTIDTPPVTEPEPRRYASMVASSDSGRLGATLETFAEAGELIDRRITSYGSAVARGGSGAVPLGKGRFKINGRNMIRHGVVAFQRAFPEDLRLTSGKKVSEVLEYARAESRLAGGNLMSAMEQSVNAGRALTAAAGWCAPSETIYDLCSLSTLDGILDLPEIQATRGGFQIPENGGPNFATIYDAIGDDGDVILSEYDVENGVEKVCVEVPCPDFVDVRLDVAYLCLTGNLLQSRGYPEAVTQFSQEAMRAFAHKVNASVIARMVAQSGAANVITEPASSDDAASALLSAVELAIWDMRYRNRMGMSQTVEVVLPAWVMGPIRAALARRSGVAAYDVSDAQILAAFRTRGAVPRFVYDWQDAFTTGGNNIGGETPITAFATTVNFLVYPAGTWVKSVRDVVNLDTVYDNEMLTRNQFTALFMEDGFNVMKMCAESRLYTAPVEVAGLVACCS